MQTPDLELDEAEFDGFAVFEVGGGPRDRLRGVPRQDVDLMAVPLPGEVEAPVDVLSERMTRVDAESAFPVFLDSRQREVALPRTEESTGDGFSDFDVSLVEPGTPVPEAVETDLERRDLTVGAMAQLVFVGGEMDADLDEGDLFDPFGGREDLEAGRLDPVSDAFQEDPVRVLRLARFTARLDGAAPTEQAVEVARATVPRLAAVPQERVTGELRSAFGQADDPSEMAAVLREVDGLEQTFPGLVGAEVGLLDAVESVEARVAALGVVGDAEQLAERQAFTAQERAMVQQAEQVSEELADLDALSDAELVELADRLDGGRGLQTEAAVELASARFGLDEAALDARLAEARQARDAVSGADLLEQMGLEQEDVGSELDGAEFGRRLLEARAARL